MSALSFDQVCDSYVENHVPFVQQANGDKLTMPETLHRNLGSIEDREKYSPVSFTKHILGKEGLSLHTKGRSLASVTTQFKKPYQKNLLLDYWTDSYDQRSPSPLVHNISYEDWGALTSLTPGEAWRMFTDITPKLAVLEADIPMNTIVNFNVPSRSLAIRIPELIIKRGDADVEDMEEGAPPKRGRVGFAKRTVELQKAGILLELSKEMQESDDMGVDIVAMFFARVGVEDEIEMVNELVKTARTGQTLQYAASPSTPYDLTKGFDILRIQAFFPRGKRADRVLGAKNPVLQYIDGLSRLYADQDTSTAGARNVAQPTLINSQSRFPRAGYLQGQDATDAGLVDNQLLIIDSMNTLGVGTYMNDPYQAENFDVVRAVTQHVLTRWWKAFLQVDAPIGLVATTHS